MVFQENLLEKAYFVAKMSGLTMVRPAGRPASSDFWKTPQVYVHFVNGQGLLVFPAPSVRERCKQKFSSPGSLKEKTLKSDEFVVV